MLLEIKGRSLRVSLTRTSRKSDWTELDEVFLATKVTEGTEVRAAPETCGVGVKI